DEMGVDAALATCVPFAIAGAAPCGDESLKAARRPLPVHARRAVRLHPCTARVIFRAARLEVIAPLPDAFRKRENERPAVSNGDDGSGYVGARGVDPIESEILHHFAAIGAADAPDRRVQFVFIRR